MTKRAALWILVGALVAGTAVVVIAFGFPGGRSSDATVSAQASNGASTRPHEPSGTKPNEPKPDEPKARSSRPTSDRRTAPERSSKSTTISAPPPAPPLRGLPTTFTEVPLVDTSRQVVSGGVVLSPVRSLPTYVWMPTAAGRFPLVVFAHGDNMSPLNYARFCTMLASSGYVVAAPSFPLEDPSRGYGLDRSDLPNEATDVSFVITSLLQGEGDLAGRIDPDEIGVVGHSDGADVALMDGYQAGKVDPRVKAIVAIAPDAMTGSIVPSTAPLLLVQGNADEVVPYSNSQTVFQQVPAPRYYETLLGADHASPILGPSQWTPVLDASVAEFLDATIAGRGPGLPALPGELSSSPLVSLETAP
jgi:dienelactone hydrolase